MKKFSWIFALILALSIGFIGCPAGDDGDDKTPPPPPPSYAKNPDATDFTVTFTATGNGNISGGVATTTIKKNGDNGGPMDPGTVTYINDPSKKGYSYAYGTGANTNYGNSVLRFKINLGEFALADYGKISFDWQATAPGVYNDTNSVNSNKRLYLYATDSEAAVTPYVENKNLIVSAIDKSKDWYDGSQPAPLVNGITLHSVEMPIIYRDGLEFLDGEVWFAFYVHAERGTYEITNLKFWAGDQVAAPTTPGESLPPAPPEVADIPADFVEINLTLTEANCNTAGTADINSTVPALSVSGSDLVVPFVVPTTEPAGQRLNVKLSQAQLDLFTANISDPNVYVQIDYTTSESTETSTFRYHVGIIDTTSNWNATDSLTAFKLEDIAVSTAGKGIKLNAPNKSRVATTGYFILQNQSKTAVTVTLKSIKLWVAPVPPVDPLDIEFAAGGVVAIGSGTVTDIATSSFKLQNTDSSYGNIGAAYFKVTLPAGTKLSDYTALDIGKGPSDELVGGLAGLLGDTGYKRVCLNIVAGITAPTDVNVINWADAPGYGGCVARTNSNNGVGAGVDTPKKMTFNFTDPANTDIDSFTALGDKTEVWFIFYIWSTGATWEFSNLVLR